MDNRYERGGIKMVYGYKRVSTTGQAKDGNSLESQEQELRANGAVEIYCDAFTGTKTDRPELNKLVAKVKKGDTIIVTKIDRLGRSLSQTSALITELLDKGVTINILNLGVLSNSSVNTLLRNVLLSFAQFERDMIIERTSEGKAIKRATDPNYKEGRKTIEVPEFEKYFKKTKKGEITVVDCCAMLGISRAKWYRLCKERVAS
jgi:DNA invertase Pin-like site-specific DNA recombinase